MNEPNMESSTRNAVCMSLSSTQEPMIKITLDIPETTYDMIREVAELLGTDRSKVTRPAIILGLAQLKVLPGLRKYVDVELLVSPNAFMQKDGR